MTTIAYKDGLIAVDSRETFGEAGHEHCHPCQKLFYVTSAYRAPFAIATSGESATGVLFVDKFLRIWDRDRLEELRAEFHCAEFECLVVTAEDGRLRAYWYDKWLRPMEVEDREGFALGSGAKVALGAMRAGASAAEAVKIAATVDPYTGLPVVVGDATGVVARIS